MKRVLLLLSAAVLGLLPGIAAADYPLGVQVFGGYDMPVIQEDVGAGTLFGAGVRGNIWKVFHGELFFRSTSQGDAEEDLNFEGYPPETITFAGGTLSGFGLNILLAAKNPANVWPYLVFGWSSNNFKPGEDFKKDETLTGWTGGFGSGFNLYQRKLYLDVNTGLLVMPFHDNNASRKNWQSRIGVQYYIPIKTNSGS